MTANSAGLRSNPGTGTRSRRAKVTIHRTTRQRAGKEFFSVKAYRGLSRTGKINARSLFGDVIPLFRPHLIFLAVGHDLDWPELSIGYKLVAGMTRNTGCAILPEYQKKP